MSRKRKEENNFFDDNKRRVVTNGGNRITLRNSEVPEWPITWRPSSPPRFDQPMPPRPDYGRPRYHEPQGRDRDRDMQSHNYPPRPARDDYRNEYRDARDVRDPRDVRDARDVRDVRDVHPRDIRNVHDVRDPRDNRGYRHDYPPLPPPPEVFDQRFAPLRAPRTEVRGPQGGYPRDRRDDRRDERRDDRREDRRDDRRDERRDDIRRDDRMIDLRSYNNNQVNVNRNYNNNPRRARVDDHMIDARQLIINTNRQTSRRKTTFAINISHIDLGTVNRGQPAHKTIELENSSNIPWKFFGVSLSRRDARLRISDQKGLCKNLLGPQFQPNLNISHRELAPTKSYAITFEYVSTDQVGSFKNSVVFHFDGGKLTRQFNIKVVDMADQALLAPSRPYKPLIVRNRTLPAIREKPSSSLSSSLSTSLGTRAEINARNRNKSQQPQQGGKGSAAVDNLDLFDLALEDLLPTAEQPLTPETHSAKFQALLAIENKQMEVDIRMYDMSGVILRKIPSQPTGFSLNVPGIAENRPSVLLRDIVYFKRTGDDSGKEYSAEVVGVLREDIDVKFEEGFKNPSQATYEVRFAFTKIFAHRMMRSLITPLPTSFLFPTQPPSSPPSKNTPKLKLFNPELNEQQKQAVSRIVHSPNYDSPYVIFGPPGTGKTLTLVEAVAQLLQKKSNTVLVCAPSNQACDVIIERLANYPSLEDMNLYRLNAIQRNVEEVSDTVKRYCMIVGGLFVSLSGDQLEKYSLIVCTCIFAGVLLELTNNGSFRKKFTHIIVDEAGHGLEPEILVPLSLKGPKTQVTIAGDPFQLGPTVRSNYSRVNGLEKSFLERLCELPAYTRYKDDGNLPPEIVSNNYHNPDYVTKLVRNYRSHAAILHLPNKLFYHGDLVESADHNVTHSLLNFQKLPSLQTNRPFPIVFNGITGEDTREGTSPSFFNVMEITEIHKWINLLLEDTSLEPRVTLQDIGVIAPFRKQVQKIRSLLTGRGKEAVKVGSVEDFQGQEKRIIIISGVRSSQTFVEFDRQHKLGLLENPKRFNVAVTRAKALLVIVANAEILALDENWAELIRYCNDNNSYVGPELSDSILHPTSTTTTTDTTTSTATTNTTTTTTATTTNTENGKVHANGQESNGKEEEENDVTKVEGKMDVDEGAERKEGSEDEETKREDNENQDDNQEQQEQQEQEPQEEEGEGEAKEEDESNIEDRDVTQELDIGSMITGQEGPEWRGSF